jgi:hypothetical protein
MKALLLFAIAPLLFSSQAHADTKFYLEPYLGYHTNAEFHFSAGNSPSASGLTYGGRVGADYMNLLLGLDYMSGSWTDDASPKDTITPGNLGFFVGYVFPAMVKVYGTYFFADKYKFSNSQGTDNYGGTEIKLGIGLTSLPVITVNFEYAFGKLTTDNGNTMSNSADVSYFGLVIGLPLEF